MAGLFDDLVPASTDAATGVPRITVTPMQSQAPAVPPVGRQLLDAIAGSESPGYNTKYGGGTFDDFADHPRDAVRIASGPNTGKTSSAAGRYQFLAPTWDAVASEAKLPDFSPGSQDAGAWFLASKTYQQKTGRDLEKDLTSAKGNPNAVAGIGRVLSGVWTSLPGGIEPNRATSSFAGRFDGAAPQDISAQSRRSGGLFDDLVPQGASAAPPVAGPPSADATGGQPAQPAPVAVNTDGLSNRVAREGLSPPVATAGEAAKNAFLNSASFNFRDELNGLAAAGGLDPNDPNVVHALTAIAKGAYLKSTGDKNAGADYQVRVSQDRADADRMREQQPGASIAGDIAGAAATLPVGVGRGVTLAERAREGAAAGGVIGAISGVGDGTDAASRATGGIVGGVTGGLVGGAAPVAIEGVGQVARGLTAPLQPVINAVRGARDPDGEAARRVVSAMQRDTRVAGGPPGMAPADYAASVRSGGPAAAIDLGGETTRALARSAANTSPEARATLNATINDRFESQSDRVAGWLNRTFGPSDTGATREALQDAAQRANRPAYARAYGDPAAQRLWDEGFEQIAQAPVVQDAIRGATRTGANRAAAEGYTPVRNPFRFDEQSQRLVLNDPNVQPNLQFWDHVKRNLDDTISKFERSGENSAARDATQLRAALVNRLDDLVPSFQQARAGAARFFGAQDALDAGTQFLTSNMPIADARRAFAQMSAPERDLFQHGFVQSLTQKIESAGDRRNVLNTIAQSPRAREQMQLALGPQGAREFEAMMRAEGVMDLARGAVQGNSTTARQLAELGLAGGAYGIGTAGDITNPNPSAIMTAVLAYGAAKGKGAIDRRVAQRVGELLASNDIAALRRGVQIVARTPALLSAFRSFDQAAARSGAIQAPGMLPSLQGSVAGHAEGDQQN